MRARHTTACAATFRWIYAGNKAMLVSVQTAFADGRY